LYNFQVEKKEYDAFIKLMLRNYTGVFNDYVNFSEEYLAKKAGTTVDTIYTYLINLQKLNIIKYIPRKNKPVVVLLSERIELQSVYINKRNYELQKERYITRMNAMLQYANSTNKCRSQILLAYFGQTDAERCGKCDVCKRRNELSLSKYEFDLILSEIKEHIQQKPIFLNDLIDEINHDDNKVIKVIQWLFDNEKIHYNEKQKLTWNQRGK
jgi:ATP-dependent DNA helicase RecQ